jgi:hypothetical protein
MFDSLHPNNTGHGHLRDAFEAYEQFIPSAVAIQTPADNAQCNPGSLYMDSGFIYACTASGTVKRAALSSF